MLKNLLAGLFVAILVSSTGGGKLLVSTETIQCVGVKKEESHTTIWFAGREANVTETVEQVYSLIQMELDKQYKRQMNMSTAAKQTVKPELPKKQIDDKNWLKIN